MPRRISGPVISAILAVVCLTLGAAGCARKPAPEAEAAIPPNPEETLGWNNSYAKAMRAFQTGDFQSAAALFERLAAKDDDPAHAAKALYGQACSLLAKAQSPEDMAAALAVWRKWQEIPNGPVHLVDPRMLTPFLENPNLFVQRGEPERQRPQPQKPGEPDLTKRLQEKEKRIQLLQKQLKALEAIHQEIQEKKKMSN